MHTSKPGWYSVWFFAAAGLFSYLLDTEFGNAMNGWTMYMAFAMYVGGIVSAGAWLVRKLED